MAETPQGSAGSPVRRGASPRSFLRKGGASPRLPAPSTTRQAGERVWYPPCLRRERRGRQVHRCPECGSYTRIVRRPTGEVYLACRDRIECGYQEALE